MAYILNEILEDSEDEYWSGKRSVKVVMEDDQTGELRYLGVGNIPNDNTAKEHLEQRFNNEDLWQLSKPIRLESVSSAIPQSPAKAIIDNFPTEAQAIDVINACANMDDVKAVLRKIVKVLFLIIKLIRRRG